MAELELRHTTLPASDAPEIVVRWATTTVVSPTNVVGYRRAMLTFGMSRMRADPEGPEAAVAVAVTAPMPVPDSNPPADIVAREESSRLHVTGRPASTFPEASRLVAVRAMFAPTMMVSAAGDTFTDATGSGLGPGPVESPPHAATARHANANARLMACRLPGDN
jgi:hypothetical protein